jgi:hypothetical protein
MIRYMFIVVVALIFPAAALAQGNGDRALGQLKKADSNHDGAVTRAEFLAYRSTQFGRLDRNKDGFITQNDIPKRLAKRAGGFTAGSLVSEFDANGDGKVSQSEFVNGPTLIFDRTDANHDDVVTPAEFNTASEAVRNQKQGAG